MKRTVVGTLIIGAAIIAAAYIHAGGFQAATTSEGVYVIDNRSGEVKYCVASAGVGGNGFVLCRGPFTGPRLSGN